MKADYEYIVVFVIGALAIYVLMPYMNVSMTYQKSMVDDHTYKVRNLPDKQIAADLLAEIKSRCERLVAHLAKSIPDDERVQRLITKFDADRISEGPNNKSYTSYSINKGERIVFCLRSRSTDSIDEPEEINTLIFVALHEVAHICTDDVGHTANFWANFRWLLEEAIQVGIYVKEDYKTNPKEYCGVDITSSPMDLPKATP